MMFFFSSTVDVDVLKDRFAKFCFFHNDYLWCGRDLAKQRISV